MPFQSKHTPRACGQWVARRARFFVRVGRGTHQHGLGAAAGEDGERAAVGALLAADHGRVHEVVPCGGEALLEVHCVVG